MSHTFGRFRPQEVIHEVGAVYAAGVDLERGSSSHHVRRGQHRRQ